MTFGIPNISHKILYERNNILFKIRNFFSKNNILEIETPILTKYTITDINILPFQVLNHNNDAKMWLITSPEYHMKRLLASGIGPIYQICHVFRNEEFGKIHNPEFTMLEWYQPFYNMFDMMEFIEKFFLNIFDIQYVEKISYKDIFIKYFSINPEAISIQELNGILKKIHQKHLINHKNSITDLLNLIFMIGIQPNIGNDVPIFIYHYPAEQALLACINKYNAYVSDRFEIFFKGLELGNGFYELIDGTEQMKRFQKDNIFRKKNNLPVQSIDMRLINAINSKYMPNCSGIAIGLDRLIMMILNTDSLHDTLSFSFENC
ncbi:elongation factor P--(R)-beta-lysine ligase [Buchnera aphidicola]|uniref:elongation factor P--(R)-beta-lysine ligase n=1 Tax=Buchnera aphidicola TaxID=9 RepID=UPI0034639DC7